MVTRRISSVAGGEYRQLMRELKSYSDVELAELGMVRSACARTAFDAAFRQPVGGLAEVVQSIRRACSARRPASTI